MVLGLAIVLSAMALTGLTTTSPQRSAIDQTQASVVEPNQAAKARLQNIVKGILAAWDKADVVCLGEDRGGKNDSDLRIAWSNIRTSFAK